MGLARVFRPRGAGDPSLRLKDGSVRDDAGAGSVRNSELTENFLQT